MEMHQIRYFLKAGETLNFTRAAEQCGVSVPSLSRGIRQLEEELGGQLFRRERHLTHLTDLGRLMVEHFSLVSRAAEAAKREARDYTRLTGARLKFGIFASIGANVLTGYLSALRNQAPELELHIWEANCEELSDALLKGELDIGILTLPEYSDRLRPIALFRERYFVAFAKGHRYDAMETVPMREFEGEAYIKRLHCEFPSNFLRLNVAKPYQAVDTRYMSEREDWVQAMVSAGLGMTVMPEFLPIVDGIEMRLVTEPEVHRQISLVTVAGRRHTKPVAIAVRTAQTFNWEQCSRA